MEETPIRAVEMVRSFLSFKFGVVCLFLAGILVGGPAPAAEIDTGGGKVVGHIVELAPVVAGKATVPPGPRQLLHQGNDVIEDMEVATDRNAGARINIVAKPARGVVRLAPETRVVFKKWLVNAAQGLDIPFSVQVGHFLAAFLPHQDGRHTVYIDTPTAHIRLEGTLIDVQVASDDTSTVYVIEGSATVMSASGHEVRLPQGTSTVVRQGKPPTNPTDHLPGFPCSGKLSEAAVDFALGVQASYEDHKDLAAQLFDKAVKENPCDGTAYHWLGFTNLQMGHASSAVEALQESLRAKRPPEAGKERVEADLKAARDAAQKTGPAQVLKPPPYVPEIQLP